MKKFVMMYEEVLKSVGENEASDTFKIEATFTEKVSLGSGDFDYVDGTNENSQNFNSLKEFIDKVKSYFGVGDVADLSWEVEGLGADVSADMERTIGENEYTYENFLKYFDYCIQNNDNSSICVHESYIEDDETVQYVSFFVSKD